MDRGPETVAPSCGEVAAPAIPRLECRDVTKTFRSGRQELTVLDHVDLDVRPGEFVAILGPSGSGKSTLLGLMAGLERAASGSIRVEGQALEDLDEDELAMLRRRRIGFVFQSFHLLDNLTARENVVLPLELLGVPGACARTEELLSRLGILDRAHHYPAQLSGGEQQRVALARAFGTRPGILLADEPTGNLDRKNGELVLDLLQELQSEEEATLVLVTHDLEIARRADRKIYLDDGRVVPAPPSVGAWP